MSKILPSKTGLGIQLQLTEDQFEVLAKKVADEMESRRGMMPQRLLTLREVCEMLCKGREAVMRLVAAGRLACVSSEGERKRFHPSEVQRYMETSRGMSHR